jgi:hypothetical protein
LDDNDKLGLCTAAGYANAARALAILNGFAIDIPTDDVVQFYADSTGYDPTVPGSDQGAVELDVLAHQLQAGFARTTGDMNPFVADFATFDPDIRAQMAWAMARFGTAYLGVELALADIDAEVWDTDAPGDQTPGTWGGHCLVAWEYDGLDDGNHVTLLTWGLKKLATWRWLRSRCVEAHALIFRQLQKTDGTNFAGLTYDQQRSMMGFTA